MCCQSDEERLSLFFLIAFGLYLLFDGSEENRRVEAWSVDPSEMPRAT